MDSILEMAGPASVLEHSKLENNNAQVQPFLTSIDSI